MDHKLKADGAAFDTEGNRAQEQGTGGTGRALCSCGWMSEELTSGGQRRGAHKAHKADPAVEETESKADDAQEEATEEQDDTTIADDLAAFEADLAAEAEELITEDNAQNDAQEAEQAFTSTLVYTGGYSPVLSRYAEGLNDDAEVTVKRSKAPKGHEVAISGPQDKVTALVARTEELEGKAMDELHTWQASDPDRKGQSNNVRFAGSKRFLEAQLTAAVSA